MDKSVAALRQELTKLRTGRAHTSLLDHITVAYYGSEVPLNQCANVNVEDSRTLAVTPWEKTMVQPIEKAIGWHGSRHRRLHGHACNRHERAGNPLNDPRLDAVFQVAHQRLATQFEQHATVEYFGLCQRLVHISPILAKIFKHLALRQGPGCLCRQAA